MQEMASDDYASYIENGKIAAGEIIGRNITNIDLIFGLTCIIKKLSIKHAEIYRGKIHFLI